MALLANQIMDPRILGNMNGRAELPQFLRAPNQSIVSQVNATQEDNRKNRKYPCPLCGKRFRFNSILSLHMRTHTGEKPFKCPYCDHRAAQKGNLKIHLRTHKQGILGKGRGRIREENRLLHELEERAILRDRQLRGSHVGHQQTSHSTPFNQKSQLPQVAPTQLQLSQTSSVEILSHTSTSPKVAVIQDEPAQPQPTGFRCSFCKGKFRKQKELERHIRILHKPYKCTLCEFAASQEEELIGHVETTHITADSGPGQKPAMAGTEKGKAIGEFPCEVCGQTFSQAWFLKGHMRKHKDSFEHSCQICGRRFKEPWFLKNHMKVHLNKLAAKGKLPTEHETSANMSNLTQDPQANVYSQYISSLHNRFLTADRAGHQPDYSQILATGGIEMKVRDMLGRMMASGLSPLTEGEGLSLQGLNHLHPPLGSNSMEYLQQSVTDGDPLNSRSYPGWQIMAPRLAVEKLMLVPKDKLQQSSYLSERCLPVDERKVFLGEPDAKAVSRPSTPGSLSHRGPAETVTETGSSLSGGAQDSRPQSSSPATGEKTYRCPLPSDYNSMQPAPLGYHLERYNFPHWQNNTDLKSPLQPTSPGASPNPKLRPKSRENWSPAAGHYLSLESREEDTPSIKKQSDIPDKDPGTDSSQHSQARKSQHEPLDLSVRPEGLAYHTDKSPGAPVQGSSSYNDGHASTVTPKLQSYPTDAGAGLHANNTFESDLAEEENYMEDAEYGCLLNHESTSHNGGGAFERSVSDQERGEEKEEGSKWKMLNKNDVGTDERGQENADVQGPGEGLQPPYGKLGQWGMIESPISSLERFTPGEGHLLQHHRNLLSVLRSPGGLSNMAPSGLKTSVNSGDTIEKEVTSVRKPFQCRYCPYSASQKGNLKTHVLCVHRKPFDNSLYPDRRLRRSHAPRRPSHLPPGITGDTCTPGREQITMTSLCGT